MRFVLSGPYCCIWIKTIVSNIAFTTGTNFFIQIHLCRFGHQAPVTGIDALSRERAISAGGFDCTIRIWKIAEESQLIYNGHRGSIECVRLINEENFLSSGDDGWVLVPPQATREILISMYLFSSLCVWSVMKKKPLCVREKAHGVSATNGQPNWISAIATLTNADIIASGKWMGRVLNALLLTRIFPVLRLAGSSACSPASTSNPNSSPSLVSGACDGSVKLWKLGDHYRTIELLFEVPVCGFVNGLAFTGDSKRLIVAVGQEHRLGRWWRIKEAVNSILIVPLDRNTKQ